MEMDLNRLKQGAAYLERGEISQAQAAFGRFLESLGPATAEPLEAATALESLALQSAGLPDATIADRALSRAVEIYRIREGEESESAANCALQLATLRLARNDLEGCRTLIDDVETRTSATAPLRVEFGALRAHLLAARGELRQAAQALEYAHELAIRRDDFPVELRARLALAWARCLAETGDVTAAETVLTELLTSVSTVASGVVVAHVLYALARLHIQSGNEARGKTFLTRCAKILAQANPNDPLLPAVTADVARLARAQGELEGARETMSGAVRLAERVWGPGELRLAELLHEAAAWEIAAGAISPDGRVEAMLDEAQSIFTNTVGETDVRLAMIVALRGRAMLASGRAEDSLPVLMHALWLLHEHNPEHNLARAHAHHTTAQTLLEIGDPGAAREHLEEALRLAAGPEGASLSADLITTLERCGQTEQR